MQSVVLSKLAGDGVMCVLLHPGEPARCFLCVVHACNQRWLCCSHGEGVGRAIGNSNHARRAVATSAGAMPGVLHMQPAATDAAVCPLHTKMLSWLFELLTAVTCLCISACCHCCLQDMCAPT